MQGNFKYFDRRKFRATHFTAGGHQLI